MKIAIIQQAPDIGGAEVFTELLMQGLSNKGHKIYFATNFEKFISLVKVYSIKLYRIPIILDFIGNYRGLIKSILYLPIATVYYLKLMSDLKKEGVRVILMSGFSEKMLVTILSLF